MSQTIVGINTWVAHRDHRVFGDDAETFNPDRWLVDDSARLSMMNRHYMPVSHSYHAAMIFLTFCTVRTRFSNMHRATCFDA